MKFAWVNGERREAESGLSGECGGCGHPMIAKCGEVIVHHWAHRTGKVCDSWWDNETAWHRAWKNQFPKDWQEYVHFADDGEKHIADVKTDQGWVLEFQYSYLKPEERRERIAFYKKLAWVVCGSRMKTDVSQFIEALQAAAPVGNGRAWKVRSSRCRLLKEWTNSFAPVFFDFNELKEIWWLLPNCSDGYLYVAPMPRAEFIQIHNGGPVLAEIFEGFLADFPRLVSGSNT